MRARMMLFAAVFLVLTVPGMTNTGRVFAHGDHDDDRGLEPGAGKWKTWVISSGKDYRVPPPPGRGETQAELRQVEDLVRHNDAAARAQIAYWDAGAPGYRWLEMISAKVLAGQPASPYAHRVYTYVALAVYDATIATWESKYHYKRERPELHGHGLETELPVPDSPSYPSEHAAAAQAAADVLSDFFPTEAASYQQMARDAGWSRVMAGVQYPSDYQAGQTLGHQVAEQVIAKLRADGSDAVWTGTVPTAPTPNCLWKGTNPGNVTAVNWKPLLLSSAGQFRPPMPPDCQSAEVQAEAAAVRDFPRTFITNYKAFYWQSPEGLQYWPYRYADKWMFEDGLDRNPPRAARAYALIAASMFDAFIASQDGKFAYWYIRPPQLLPAITTLFPTPNFPSYPSNHSTFSATRSEILAYLFPAHAGFIRAVGKEAGDSRIWAGIHYQMDNLAGVALGTSVAGVFIDHAQHDGSE